MPERMLTMHNYGKYWAYKMKQAYWIIMLLLLAACKQTETTQTETDEWVYLFDGYNTEAWTEYQKSDLSDAWSVKDSALIFTPPGEGYHTIVTKDTYTDFVLELDWKISKNGNSGIFWGVSQDTIYPVAYLTGPEIQIRDNRMANDSLVHPKHRAGSLFDIIAPATDPVAPVGEWNTCRITVNHEANEARVVLNNTELMRFPLHGAQWDSLVGQSKFRDWEGFGKYRTGHIALQDHGNAVAFRNIRIKRINN